MSTDCQSGRSEKKILLLADTVVDPLVRLLENSAELPALRAEPAPYGQVYQCLVDEINPAWAGKPDYLLVWTTPHLTLPSLERVMAFETLSTDKLWQEVEEFASAVIRAAARVRLTMVVSWVIPAHQRWIQSLTWKHQVGAANLVARANLLLAERFAAHSNIVLLDGAYWQSSLGGRAYDLRLYAIGKILYSFPLFARAACEIKAVLRGALGLGKKVVVCDLDNTLWGGVVGDDGSDNIRLGPPDPVGECYREVQRSLKALRGRGILLAICSKNDEAFALSVIEEHPAMILRKSDFVSWRINWRDKAENLVELAAELNLGLDSFVFLDDSPQERDQIRRLLPSIYVPDLPSEPQECAAFVASLSCFETMSLNKEDLERSAMYQAEKIRKESVTMTGSIEEWLRSLDLRVKASRLSRQTLPRAAQLLNKTNQFNLSVRRMEEKVFWEWANRAGNAVYVFEILDRFGDFGLTALGSLSGNGSKHGVISDFVMSCRVMGKRIEEALLAYLLQQAQSMEFRSLAAPASKTDRNGPALDFFGTKYVSGTSNELDPEKIRLPEGIKIVEASN